MATLSSFFGDAQGSGTDTSIITDPTKMPFQGSRWNHPYFKYGATNYDSDGAAQFWNGIKFQCDETFDTMVLAAENTWQTHVDYSGGAGRLYWIIGVSANSQPNTESWIRITVDGAAYTFKKQNMSISEDTASYLASNKETTTSNSAYHDRAYWGYFTDLPQTGSGYNPSPNSYYEYGEHRYDPADYWGSRPDKYGVRSANQYIGVLSIASCYKWQVPYLSFSNSLKIEHYGTTGILTNAGSFSDTAGAGWMKEPTVEI
jgi:hypothetical protein